MCLVLLVAAAAAVNARAPGGSLRKGPVGQTRLLAQKAVAVSTSLAARKNASTKATAVRMTVQAGENNASSRSLPVHFTAQARKGNASAAAGRSASRVSSGARRQQTIRVCNAHPDAGGLSVWQDDGDSLHTKLTEKDAIAPKTCREFLTSIGLGDFLEFRVQSAREPLYLPAAPVRPNTVALIVVYEKTKEQPGLWLHYFDHLVNAQVAAVSVVPGLPADAAVQLSCVAGACGVGANESLPFGDVHALHPGRYAVVAPNGISMQIDAQGGECYAVLAMGPGEAMVFPPQGQSQAPFSGTNSKGPFTVLALAAAAIQLVF